MLSTLFEDSIWYVQNLKKKDSQPGRRVYIRSQFAAFEGVIWILKEIVLKAQASNEEIISLTNAEYQLLSEKIFDLTSKCDPEEHVKYLRLPENSLFTIKL